MFARDQSWSTPGGMPRGRWVQDRHCTPSSLALALNCSRGSPTFVSSRPQIRRSAAMSVQYNAVSSMPPLYIVLYCLTPPEFRRYSSLNLCPRYPAWGGNGDRVDCACNKSDGGGIRLVNRRCASDNLQVWQKTARPFGFAQIGRASCRERVSCCV